jgi:hypothetical protein
MIFEAKRTTGSLAEGPSLDFAPGMGYFSVKHIPGA